jgi:hypothetical protein
MKRLFLFCLVTYCVQFANAQFSGKGSGTEEDPYLVTSALNVDEIRYFQGKEGVVFKLMNDIDMSGFIEDTYANAGWNPLPDFQGEFDGNGHTISGLFINRPKVADIGFFSKITGSCIHDLILVYDGDVMGIAVPVHIGNYKYYNGSVGGLCATAIDSDIERCIVKGKKFKGLDRVGGLLGCATSSTSSSKVTECIVECVSVVGDDCGGLIGCCNKYQITNNRVQTTMFFYDCPKEPDYSPHFCGGVVGDSYYQGGNNKIFNNFFKGNIHSYSDPFEYDSKSYVGGISGGTGGYSNVAISDSIIFHYYTNNGRQIVGRIGGIGGASPTATNANKAYSKTVIMKGKECSYATDSENDGMGIGEILLKNENMYRNMGWDMDNVWTIDDGNSYPRLKWEVEKEMDKHKLIITNQGKEINDNDELTFLAEKVTTNLGGGISYTYYQCIPDEPIIENTSSRSQQVTVTITSEDFAHLKWAGINNQETDMKEATETRTCQLERSASVPLKLHAIFAEQDFGSYTANVQVSCDNFTRNFSIRFSNENPNKPICPTPFIDYADGKLTFSCDIEGTPEYHVNITDPDVNTFTVNGELQLERTYNVEAYATAEGYQPSETACLTLCWIDKDIVEYTDGLVKEEGFPLKIRTDKGAVSVSGVLPNTFVSAYSLDGILLDSTTSASGTVNLKIPANTDAVILKFGDNSIKVRIK